MTEAGHETQALVTGGGGFLGGAIVAHLLAAGYRVRSFGRGDYPALQRMGVTVFRGDLTDRLATRQACAGCAIVFHNAAKAALWGDWDSFFRPNVVGTENVLEACRREGVGRLVYTSTASVVFGNRDIEGGDESLPYPARPRSPYTATKAHAERLVLAANSPILRTLSLRPHLIWGPHDTQIIPRIIAQARCGKMRRVGNGRNKASITYIDNAALAHIQAAEALMGNPQASGKPYFIAQEEPVYLWELIDRILHLAGIPPLDRSVPRHAAIALGIALDGLHRVLPLRGEPRMTRLLAEELSTSHWFDISAAKGELGYVPVVSTEEGLRRLALWLAGVPA